MNEMIYIATAHHKWEFWIDTQLKYIRKHVKSPHQIYTCVSNIDEKHFKKFDFCEEAPNRHMQRHAHKLNYLAKKIAANSTDDDDIIMFIDSDAFPISDFVPFIKKKIETNKLVAVRRDENVGDMQPHPIFCATTVGFWKEIRGDWSKGRWKNADGRIVKDVGGKLLKILRKKNVDWFPLLRTNKRNPHPVFYGIYGNIIYHFGAGSRHKTCRSDGPGEGIRGGRKKRRRMYAMAKKTKDKIQNNDETFYSNLMTEEVEKKMDRRGVVKYIIRKTNAESYLEIGVGGGYVFNKINCAKVGVDPNSKHATNHQTSDVFFKTNNKTFDVIFIDGLHHADQVEQDIVNSLAILNNGGVIICHDMNPAREISQIVPREVNRWNGDCWKAWVKLRSRSPELEMYVINANHGCGIIKKGSQKTIDLNGIDLNWRNLCENRNEWLNLISVKDFLRRTRQLKNIRS